MVSDVGSLGPVVFFASRCYFCKRKHSLPSSPLLWSLLLLLLFRSSVHCFAALSTLIQISSILCQCVLKVIV